VLGSVQLSNAARKASSLKAADAIVNMHYFASQGDGLNLLPFGSILKCVLVMKG
jgi:hypothetical protein